MYYSNNSNHVGSLPVDSETELNSLPLNSKIKPNLSDDQTKNPALESFIKKIKELKDHWESKNKFVINNYDLKSNILNLKEKDILVNKIKAQFQKKNLHKGATEVFNAIAYVNLEPDQKVYVAGYLDLAYEEALVKSITQVQRTIDVVRLDKDYRSLVYDCVKDINLKPIPRTKTRRPFICRIFIA